MLFSGKYLQLFSEFLTMKFPSLIIISLLSLASCTIDWNDEKTMQIQSLETKILSLETENKALKIENATIKEEVTLIKAG